MIFIVPGLTGAAIAGERDRQTLDLLLSTQVSTLWIVLGKILASLSYVFLLMVASLPLFSLVFLFGGVSPSQVALAFVISLVSALTLGTIGVFLSVLIRRGPTATVLTYTVTFIAAHRDPAAERLHWHGLRLLDGCARSRSFFLWWSTPWRRWRR